MITLITNNRKISNSKTTIHSSSKTRTLQEILTYKIIRHFLQNDLDISAHNFICPILDISQQTQKFSLKEMLHNRIIKNLVKKEYLSSLESAFVKNDIPPSFFGLFVEESPTFFDLSSCSCFGDFDVFSKEYDLFSSFMSI